MTAAEREALEGCFPPDQAEWIVLGIVMMGFLNKFMHAIGVELESSTFAEVAELLGADWSPGQAGRDLDPTARSLPPRADTIRTKLRIVPHMPAVLRLDMKWQRGVPGKWPAAGAFLRDLTGHDFPVLARLRHGRAVKRIASMLRENLDPATTEIGLEAKVLTGAVFAEMVVDQALATDVRALATKHGVAETRLDEVRRFATTSEAEPREGDARMRATLLLARAASPSPAKIDAGIVAVCRDARLPSSAIVELVTWLAVLQMLHRLTSYYPPAPESVSPGMMSHVQSVALSPKGSAPGPGCGKLRGE